MTMFSNQRELYEQGAPTQQQFNSITVGTVVDTNDPQQMGRVRVVCPQWGDSWTANVEDLPWAIYMSPFGGQTQTGPRGPGIQESEGGLSYGVWWIPKVNAQVLIMCVDGNPANRVYIGCIFDQFTPHTMPHGRFMYEDHPDLEKGSSDAAPYGPFTSAEKLVQPTAENQRQAFGNKAEPNFEWRSRGADYTVSRVDVSQLGQTYSKVQDDKDATHDDWVNTQGYQTSRIDPDAPSSLSDRNYDSQVYSITTPGFHSLSMDDRQENCRVRWRTSSGAQFLIDDTNERIYISTAKGNNWIELDQDGNIDVFTSNKLNIHSIKEVNITSDETVRIHGKKGVHIRSDDEIRTEAVKDIHIKTAQNLRVHSTQATYFMANGAFHVKTSDSLFLEASSNLHAKAGSNLNLNSGSATNILASGNIVQTGSQIHLNGPGASEASAATAPNEQPAFWTNRVPLHEPWARTMTKTDFTHAPEFEYDNKQVNRSERGRTIDRGMYWRR